MHTETFLSLSTSSYWYSPKMNLTCSSLLTFRLSEGGTYRSRRAFADLALGRTEFNPKHRIIFRCQEVFVRDWSLMIWIHPDTFFQRRVTVAFWHLSRIWPSQLAPILSAVSFHKFILFASDVPWVRPMHSFVSHVLQGDVMLRPLKALAALKQLDTGRAMQLLQQVADSWLWWRSRLSWLQIPFWKAGFNAAAKTRLESFICSSRFVSHFICLPC